MELIAWRGQFVLPKGVDCVSEALHWDVMRQSSELIVVKLCWMVHLSLTFLGVVEKKRRAMQIIILKLIGYSWLLVLSLNLNFMSLDWWGHLTWWNLLRCYIVLHTFHSSRLVVLITKLLMIFDRFLEFLQCYMSLLETTGRLLPWMLWLRSPLLDRLKTFTILVHNYNIFVSALWLIIWWRYDVCWSVCQINLVEILDSKLLWAFGYAYRLSSVINNFKILSALFVVLAWCCTSIQIVCKLNSFNGCMFLSAWMRYFIYITNSILNLNSARKWIGSIYIINRCVINSMYLFVIHFLVPCHLF